MGLDNGIELSIPIDLTGGLARESARDLEEIEISPAGLVLHWPRLNADIYLPALLKGLFGTVEGRWLWYWSTWSGNGPRAKSKDRSQ